MEAAPNGVRVNAVAPGLAWNPFLASERASFITGEVLCVSGGYYLHT
jgi:3-oxoacyl-[acyl-carrier protein] reductase